MIKILQILLLPYFVKCSTSICVAQVCTNLCDYGYVVVDGCTTCQCIDPCKGVVCPPCQKCVNNTCLKGQICLPSFKCVPVCPTMQCEQYCLYGYEYDSLGCQTCQCADPCRNHICGIDEYCDVQPVPCYEEFDYGYKATCVKKCENLVCPLVYCPYGYEVDCNNCPTCKCRTPCKGVVCPLYHYCIEETILCLIPPCPPLFVVCKHYCANQKLLIDDCGLAVQCTSQACPKNYSCTAVPFDSRSFCCSSNI